MNKKVMKLASIGKRLGAYCIDRVIPFILLLITITIAAGLIPQQSMDPFGFSFGFGYGFGMGVSPVASIFKFVSVLLVFAAYLAVQIIFYTRSQTIGKAILGLQVINSDDGNPACFWKMILREWFAKKASGAVFMLGFIWILIDDKRRGWHDKMVDTYVIDIRESVSNETTEGGEISG